ncbi:MAG: sugar transferase [Caulobacteraceae bacterium]
MPPIRRRDSLALTLASLFIALAIMPLLYGLVAFHGDFDRMMETTVLQHVALNCAANAFVMLTALNLTGRFDRKLAQVFTWTLVAHGALAFGTLISRHYYSIPMLVVGAPCSALLGASVMAIQHRSGRLRVGFVGPWRADVAHPQLHCECIEHPRAAIGGYDLLLITYGAQIPAKWTGAVARAMVAGKRVRHVAEYLEESRGLVAIEHFNLDHLPEAGLTSYRLRKRLLDVAVVVAALPAALPTTGLAALAIWLTMGRPILFVQPRVGLGGGLFPMFKLRTMRAGEAGHTGAITAQGDARITPVGRWLRRFHIDELPQLWNVLRGDMSLVGPRPEQPGLAKEYSRRVPAFAYRHMVRPGITGWAQVRAGYAADLAQTQVKLGFDLYYLKNFSFALDIQILARTLWTLATGAGVR